jgi:ATP-dependent exoDNAse (exonuclease V) alpha subunit
MTQSEALAILKTGSNVFVTGEPGSGKTHTINQYVAYLRARGIEPAVTASTGIAATHIHGMTIHSWSGIGIKTTLGRSDLDAIALNKPIVKRVRRANVLIIDEVSMLSPETLSMVDAVCREIKEGSEPFGGIQIVLVGDFFQLPPIVKPAVGGDSQILFMEESSARFAYDSPAWGRANPVVCYLTEQHRQDDGDYLALLSAIRRNAFGDEHLRRLADRRVRRDAAPPGAPKLFSHNVDVDRVNEGILAGLPGELHVFTLSSQGPEPLVSALKKGCLSPETLRLKVGAAVMFTKNNPQEGFVNGTLGTVEAFDGHDHHPIVRTRSGRRIAVESMDWAVEEHGTIRARITQVPLRLAWAITVHKSQGMSLDEAVMDLRDVFEFGQGYVALSRVRRLSGLHLLGWTERAFQVHPDVSTKDGEFRAQSEQAARAFSGMTVEEMTAKHERFLRLCGGRGLPGVRSPSSRFAWDLTPSRQGVGSRPEGLPTPIRARHPGAYSAWDKTQDEQLRELFVKGTPVAGLAQTFNRTRGAIRSRLAKLGLVGDRSITGSPRNTLEHKQDA